MTALTFTTSAHCTASRCGWVRQWQTGSAELACDAAITLAERELARHTTERHPRRPRTGEPVSARGGVTWRGQTHSLPAWSQRLGIPVTTLGSRLARGWGVERALSTPVRPKADVR